MIASDNWHALKATHEEEKTTLLQRPEEAEKQLEPITQELDTLKSHITDMTVAIFGKYSLVHRKPLVSVFAGLLTLVFLCPGRKNNIALQVSLVKLKAIYTYLEQLYTGGMYAITSVKDVATPPEEQGYAQ